MTARQPPGEKGAKACTIGNTSLASWIFCTYFPGVQGIGLFLRDGGEGMFGAIIGDIVGSRFEFDNCKSKEFELFTNTCDYTDDTVMTLAVAKALLIYGTITDMITAY